jgi:NADPH-dependent glutamate synthase beta subunit-like oxidoreductase
MKTTHYPGEVLAKMREIVDDCMGDAPPYCEATCPMHTDVKGYVNLIAEGKHKEAMRVIREKLFLPATLGRICAHPCEEKCKREEAFREPMAIAALKRFVADHHDDEREWDLTVAPSTGKRVAIVGAGPAGAQAALDLRRKGHEVTLFEKLEVVGGMMRVGIPEYRLPRQIIDREYSLLERLGVNFRLGVEIGKDLTFEEIEKNHDAVILAIGAHKGVVIPMDGHDKQGVTHAVDFLRDVSLTKQAKVGKRIAVIGGGNVAIDVARSARRIGVDEVHLLCLEEKDKMPAHDWEVEEALEEGVTLHDAYGPEVILGDGDRVEGIAIKKCLATHDQEGRFNPSFDPENRKVLDVDTVVFAVGQSVDTSWLPGDRFETLRGGRIKVDPVTFRAGETTCFVAGDCSGSSVIAIEAMANGRSAAESVDRLLKGQDLALDRERETTYETWLEREIKETDEDLPRVETPKLDPDERIRSFDEVDLGFDEQQALEEASRCLACECKLCMSECLMLGDYCECPKDLFESILETGEVDPEIPYSCNMCSQCTIACPKDFPMSERFFDMRKEMVRENKGKSPMKGHGAIEMHQFLGFSSLFNMAKPSKRKER